MTNKLFKHFWESNWTIYVWFWAILCLMVIGGWVLQVTFLGEWIRLRDDIDALPFGFWSYLDQAPKWFLFVNGILFTTIVMPALIKHGISRRSFFHASLRKGLTVSVLFVAILIIANLLEFGVARWLGETLIFRFSAQDVWVNPVFNAVKLYLDMLLIFIAGWLVGLSFYHKGWLRGIVYSIVALAPFFLIHFIGQSENVHVAALGSAAMIAAYVVSTVLLCLWARRMVSRVAVR
ncbi:hypothetical protein DUZ99_06210 [Xylanibacillus composti]|uniref:Uncharacterized protein n=1 Tax=Xylanibacillus composti TaxID=1572762 RepID=A0A8J4H5Z2_9BACL|nr:hypothetical protein [Xylanibacillus composti]MDT9724585.1 hypothetical protein [Xylanibacillus composti]GIQ70255.1 hypothetical protein XYCOK13_30790 [Xylanibacillus composti]